MSPLLIVVASELPRDRSTLLVRFLAAGPLLADAIADLTALLLLLLRGLDDDGKVPAIDLDAIIRGAKIRCPKCAWQPAAHDRWECSCGFIWNTFDTRGKCPACSHQWHDTACLACHAWSPHEDWYAR